MSEDALRPELRSRIERLVGARVETCRRVAGGYTPALRFVCGTRAGSFFVKVGATKWTSVFLRREMRVYQTLAGDFMPRFVAAEDDEAAPVLVIEDLSTHHWPPPWDARHVELTLAQIDNLHHTKAPVEIFETFAEAHEGMGGNWREVAADPAPLLALGLADAAWLEAALPTLLRYEELCPTEGESLTHFDLRSDNICLTGGGALFVDWNGACLSNPRLDLGFWLPSLAYESGVAPERILPDAPEVAAFVSGFFAARAGLPDIPDAPRVRWVQRRQLETALPWAARALDLPPPRGRGSRVTT